MTRPRNQHTGLLTFCLCAGACTDPSYIDASDAAAGRHDASTPAVGTRISDPFDASSEDAQVADAQTLAPPAWAQAALGTYAVRTRMFARGAGLGGVVNPVMAEWLWLATVSFDPSANLVEMSSEVCNATGTNTFAGVAVDVSLAYPTQLNPHRYLVLDDGDGWHTDGTPVAYGFDPNPTAQCTMMAGAQVTSTSVQRNWLPGGLCTCPTDPNALPTSSDDCRVNDEDGDKHPGVTVVASSLNQDYYAVATDGSDYVSGKYDSAGAFASAAYHQVYSNQQIACDPEPCVRADSIPCDAKLNPAVLKLVRKQGDPQAFTCDDVIKQASKLFDATTVQFPEGC